MIIDVVAVRPALGSLPSVLIYGDSVVACIKGPEA